MLHRLRHLVMGLLALTLAWAVLAGCTGASSASSGPLLVSAAADLTPAFTELGQRFQEETGFPVTFNFGSSGQLAQQIHEGAPVDLFASANARYVDELIQAGLVLPGSDRLYARGRLILWTRVDSPLHVERIEDLTDPRLQRIAIANPAHAPYGVAARQALQAAGLWEALQPKLVFGENVLQTRQFAETGNVDVALIALSLGMANQGRWSLIPETLHRPLDQKLVIIARAPHRQLASRFSDFVASPAGREVMQRYGFLLPDEVSAP